MFKGIQQGVVKLTIGVAKCDTIQNIMRDLKSLRSMWNWIIGILYIWLIVYAVIKYPDTVKTAITVTGGLLTAIFTNYVWSKRAEKKDNNQNNKNKGTSHEGNDSEHNQSA